ncbi:MAG: RecX family transcriptional regulator [Nitrospinae bacterium]|nr:RecX family transcriptional regulator [Nitrospinota bacterium]
MEQGLRRALAAAYRLLARRGRSEHELRGALEKRETAPDTIDAAVEYLRERRLVDDRKFAHDCAQSLARNKKVGPRYLRDALKKKGIDEKLIQEAVAETFSDPLRERNEIRALVEKKSKAMKKDATPLQRKKKLFDFLIRRGFSYDAVMKALNAREDAE